MKKLRLFFLLILACQLAHGQWYDPEKVNKKTTKIYLEAYNEAYNGNYEKSLLLLEQVLKKDPKHVEAFLTRSNIYAELKQYGRSVESFETAYQLDSFFSRIYTLPYAIALAGNGQFEKAAVVLDLYARDSGLNTQTKKSIAYRRANIDFALDFKKKHKATDSSFLPISAGSGPNSSEQEYYPSFTIDGKKMVFTRRLNGVNEDFFESDFVDGKWQNAKPIDGEINTSFNEGAQTLSQDGEWLIFTACNYPGGTGSCDLYISKKMKNGLWSQPENLGQPLNSFFWDSGPSLSPDKKTLYFSSDRPGGYGGKDIWISQRNASGKWSLPENAGPLINTAGNESCPFIHPDNQTLYFISNGLPGYGSTDIYLCRKDTNGNWQTPENLGYPINTIDEEGSLAVMSDGKTAFFASDRENNNSNLDLYSFTLNPNISAKKTIWMTGKVIDKHTKQGLPSSVELSDLEHTSNNMKIQTNEDGEFLVSLPESNQYGFFVKRKGYLYFTAHYQSTDLLEQGSKVMIELEPIVNESKLELKNIFFENKSFQLKKESLGELNTLVEWMTENPQIELEIKGHTDNVGKKEDNLLLSKKRAESVMQFLATNGVDSKRMKAIGLGDTMPLEDNSTEEGRSHNRRTEIIISIKP